MVDGPNGEFVVLFRRLLAVNALHVLLAFVLLGVGLVFRGQQPE
jgi:hypothetical protein